MSFPPRKRRSTAATTATEAKLHARPFEVKRPSVVRSPVIYASPHSGRLYPDMFVAQSRLSQSALRQSEDSYVDLIFAKAPEFGSPLLKAHFPRAYVDANRHERELDPRVISGLQSQGADIHSNRVSAGLGVIPRIVADGQLIYSEKLPMEEALRRLEFCYRPYHRALQQLIEDAHHKFGTAIVVDCHSMPSQGGMPLRPKDPRIDFVLGDRFGVSCAPSLSGLIECHLMRQGFHVVRNTPYAGGHVAQTYGRPGRGVHVIQIEINRSLYLDEQRITRTNGFDGLRRQMEDLMAELALVDVGALMPAQAAE